MSFGDDREAGGVMAVIPNPFASKGGGLPLTGGTLTGPLLIQYGTAGTGLIVQGPTGGSGTGIAVTGTGAVAFNVPASGHFNDYTFRDSNAGGPFGAFYSGIGLIQGQNLVANNQFQSGAFGPNVDLDVQTAGHGLFIANGGGQAGTNAKIGTGSLNAGGGVGTVANTKVTANSYIFLTDTNTSVTNVGNLAVISQSAGTNFVVQSSNASDVSTFNYFIVEPG